MANHYRCNCCGFNKWYDDILLSAQTLKTFPRSKKHFCLEFGVPKEWLKRALRRLEIEMTLRVFLDEFTWEQTKAIYDLAKNDGVILWKENA